MKKEVLIDRLETTDPDEIEEIDNHDYLEMFITAKRIEGSESRVIFRGGDSMTIEEILTGESKNVEFKVSRPEKSIKYMKSVIAFANGKGGRIIFGVDDHTRLIVGIPEENVFHEIDAITNAISDSCEPVIVPDVYPQTIDGKTIVIAEISAGKQKPYYIKADGITDGVYMRVSGTSRKADRAMTQEMYYESEGRSYDTVIRRELSVSDMEIEEFCAGLKEVAIANCKNDAQRQAVKDITKNHLLSWGILAEDEAGMLHPTNAWVFLNGQDAFLSKIQCGMFKGTTRAVFVDKRDYDGPLWKQIEDAFQFVLRNIHLGAKFEGIYRKDIYELPPDSIRELLINSVMNCSYLQSSHIQVAVYDDRLEITSPGGLMPGVTIGRMKEGYSQIRNRALAHAFSYMNLIEGWGTGIPRLLREMKEYGLEEPEFIDMEIALRINLYRAQADGGVYRENVKTVRESKSRYIECAKKAKTVRESEIERIECAESALNRELSAQERMIVGYIVHNEAITSLQLMTLLGVKKRRAQVILRKMTDERILCKKGESRSTRYIFNESLVR
jgi:ATP-dependent DNA helicase RecG